MLLSYQVTCMEKMDTEVIRDASKVEGGAVERGGFRAELTRGSII